MESYIKQGMVHVGSDKEVCQKEITETQRRLNGTAKAMSNIFGVGCEGSEQSAKRTWSNYNSNSCSIAALRVTQKLHKDLNPDGSPKTRPIVGASSCMGARASEVLADFLDAVVRSIDTI